MRVRPWLLLLAVVTLAPAVVLFGGRAQTQIPRVWDDDAVERITLPMVGLGKPSHHVSAEYYYRIPAAKIPKAYAVYAPDREPVGSLDWLKTQEPADAIDFSRLVSDGDWIRAGQLVFDAPATNGLLGGPSAEAFRAYSGSPLYPRPAKDGTYPWIRYWVNRKGDVRAFFTECGSCHTRVLEDGRVIPGAQGNLNESFTLAAALQRGALWSSGSRANGEIPQRHG